MGDFVRDLKKRVEHSLGQGPAWGEVNPLVVIGLTEAMLDLELTEEQMYKAVRGYVRQLASQIHPDRQTKNVSEKRRQQIFQAFEILDDRRQFSKALSEFRSLKSEDRKETRMLREILANTQESLARLQEKEAEFVNGLDQLGRDRLLFEAQRAPILEMVESLRVQNKALAEQVKTIPPLNTKIGNLNGKIDSLQEKLLAAEKRYKRLFVYISQLGAVSGSLESVSAFDSRWALVASLTRRSGKSVRAPAGDTGWSKDFHRVAHLYIDRHSRKLMLGRWRAFCEKFGSVSDKGRLYPTLHLLEMTGGKARVIYGPKALWLSGRVVGSVSPSDYLIGESDLVHSLFGDVVLRHLTPRLVVGGLMVLEKTHKTGIYREGHEFPRPNWETRRIILGAG